MIPSSFHIYDASAGSGKTYALVSRYLERLFIAEEPEFFKRLLAITFTNKAVGEMKDRVLHSLRAFSQWQAPNDPPEMMEDIHTATGMTLERIQAKSRLLLDDILNNYGALNITTIDQFTSSVIRAFAMDLNLAVNYSIEMNTDDLLSEAVDLLIAKAGKDKLLTGVLVDFAIEKTEADKSWDITYDLNDIAKLLVNENHIPYLKTLAEKNLPKFNALKSHLFECIDRDYNAAVERANATLDRIQSAGLEPSDFTRKALYNHFEKARAGNFDRLYDNKLYEAITEGRLYNKTAAEEVKTKIDNLIPFFESSYSAIKVLVHRYLFHKNILGNLTPLSLLREIREIVQQLKQERNFILISDFNTLVHKELVEQPVPFIYERIGEKYKHFFIDEFQDTSVLQWENIIPLINNALSGPGASAMIVGDAKQAIYRWRGGKAEQLLQIKTHNPFHVNAEHHILDKNYRSLKDLVEFNNDFFRFISGFALKNNTYSELYSACKQEATRDTGGFVGLHFIEAYTAEEAEPGYCKGVHERIVDCLAKGYSYKDICVLVRKRKEGIAVAKYLTEFVDVPIISSETLLLSHSQKVRFLTDVLTALQEPSNKVVAAGVLEYIGRRILHLSEIHEFITETLSEDFNDTLHKLQSHGFTVDVHTLWSLPLYDKLSFLIRTFRLNESPDAYIQYFQDVALDYQQNHDKTIDFLTYFERQANQLSIPSPENRDAVLIMTIHKAKGLQFPVVIFPFANLDMYREEKPKAWVEVNPDEYLGFPYAFVNVNKTIKAFGSQFEAIYEQRQQLLELDNINLLYVAMTRAQEQLHVLSEARYKSGAIQINERTYGSLFIKYLQHLNQWEDGKHHYEFGTPTSNAKAKTTSDDSFESLSYTPSALYNPALAFHTNVKYLWSPAQKSAVEYGNLLHLLMSRLQTKAHLEMHLDDLVSEGRIGLDYVNNLAEDARKILEDARLKDYYTPSCTAYNERSIVTPSGDTLRPDRIVITAPDDAVLIDYKTGRPNASHRDQMMQYEQVMRDMGFLRVKKILVYIGDTISVKEV